MSRDQDHEHLRRMTELFSVLLDLDSQDDPLDLVELALQVAIDQLDARSGYLALYDEPEDVVDNPHWTHTIEAAPSLAPGTPQVSQSIIRHTLEIGECQRIVSALGDQRFRDKASVRDLEITSVLCAPLGSEGLGVIYLQDRRTGFFQDKDRDYFARLARLIGPYVDRLLLRDRHRSPQPEEEVEAPPATFTTDAKEPSSVAGPSWMGPIPDDEMVTYKEAKDQFTRHFLWWSWRRFGNKTRAAAEVGPARGQFFSLWKRLELDVWVEAWNRTRYDEGRDGPQP